MRLWPVGTIHSKTLPSPEVLKAHQGESEANAKTRRADNLIKVIGTQGMDYNQTYIFSTVCC